MAFDLLDLALDRFFVNQPSGICKTSSTSLLLVIALWVPPAICSLTLGADIFRRKIGRLITAKSIHDRQFSFAVSIFGSLVIQLVCWNLAGAKILARDNPSNYSSQLFYTWLIRPLPASLITFMSAIMPTQYLENALEIQLVECLMGFLTVETFDFIRKATNSAYEDAENITLSNGFATGLRSLNDASRLGLAGWIISLVTLVSLLVLLYIRVGYNTDKEREVHEPVLRVWIGWCVLCNVMRMGAGLAIWASIPKLYSQVFCPSLSSTGLIAGLSVLIAAVDHLWRGLFFQAVADSGKGPNFIISNDSNQSRRGVYQV